MHAERQICLRREFDLRRKRALLPLFIERQIVIIQPDLPHRQAFFMRAERRKFFQALLGNALFGVRMDARGEVHLFVCFGEFRRAVRRGQIVARAHRQVHALVPHAGNHIVKIAEFFVIQVAVRIDKHQKISLPSSISRSGFKRESSPFSFSAHKIIPSLTMPQSLAGLRLVTITTFLPTISSGV